MNTAALNKKSSIFANKWLKVIAATFVALYLIIWAISSPLSKHFIKPILLEHKLFLSSDSSISYNPFLSQVTISDLAVYRGSKDAPETVLSINKFTVRLTLFRLLFDKIVVSKFELNEAYIKVEKSSADLLVAGINLTQPQSNETDTPETPTEPEAQFAYQLILPKLAIKQLNIDINNDDKPHQFIINELIVSKLKANQQSQQAKLSLDSLFDKTALELTADADFTQGQGEINSQLSIVDYPIEKLQPYVEELSDLSGSLSFSAKQQVTIAPEDIKLHISKAKLKNENLVVGYQQQFFNLENLENTISDLKLTLAQGEITDLAGTGQLSLKNADIHYEKPSQKLAYFEHLALNDIGFSFSDGPQVSIAGLVIDNIYGSKNHDTELPPIMTLKQFSISDIVVNKQQLAVNEIILDSLQGDLILDKEKAVSNLVTLPMTEKEEEELSEAVHEVDREINTQKADYLISLNDFSLINDNQITILDHSVEPVKTRKLFIDTLHLGALSNAKDKQEQKTPFEIVGRSNKYAHFNFEGFTQPFASKPTHHLQGFLKELSLPALSRYMKKAVQMELKSGQLNTDVNVTLAGEELNGNVVILLQGLETAIANSDEAGALIDQGALPFNMAISMLKDSNGDVELDVPLSGSTSDPSFGVSSIVTLITQKAIWMATQDYLLTTFVPYANIVSAAMKVGEFALKLRFDDLNYQTKQIEPNALQQAYLQSFIALMQDKKDTRVNICAISVPADIDLAAGKEITDKKHILQLKELAEQRESAFKDYIIKHGNIASSRLLLCAPKIDSSKGAQPRIELSV
ncbi:MAG: DUF748 domain-containing protein [Colwellia sp.]|nr:DUF748 domain-containing protein [Colwellia sp.]MCW9082559.1 DUF748 domain-containing protein [Colwellia sp.]